MNNAAPRSVFGLTHGASLPGSRPRHDIEAQVLNGSHHPDGATRAHHPDGAIKHPELVQRRLIVCPGPVRLVTRMTRESLYVAVMFLVPVIVIRYLVPFRLPVTPIR